MTTYHVRIAGDFQTYLGTSYNPALVKVSPDKILEDQLDFSEAEVIKDATDPEITMNVKTNIEVTITYNGISKTYPVGSNATVSKDKEFDLNTIRLTAELFSAANFPKKGGSRKNRRKTNRSRKSRRSSRRN